MFRRVMDDRGMFVDRKRVAVGREQKLAEIFVLASPSVRIVWFPTCGIAEAGNCSLYSMYFMPVILF